MQRDALLPPLEFRFTEPQDVALYGDEWITYSELDIATTDSRKLIAWEAEIGAPLPAVMDGQREDSIFGNMGATWLGLKLAGRSFPFAEYSPTTMLIEWRTKEVEVGKDQQDERSAPTPADSPTLLPSGVSGSATSGTATTPMATVVLPTMPAAAEG